ncbi:hypothetical protein Y032_0464g1925 [Ancylostoma ceylanicum]|uniref:Uncharacterized protein n=1 Tax=Ancylostoma ceylanicum TaxID=53326 RepID=A0A016WXL5_9BILA|nr:hypothetical protein Y032_0464g1925 [Ancylostoma ceylanicum]
MVHRVAIRISNAKQVVRRFIDQAHKGTRDLHGVLVPLRACNASYQSADLSFRKGDSFLLLLLELTVRSGWIEGSTH